MSNDNLTMTERLSQVATRANALCQTVEDQVGIIQSTLSETVTHLNQQTNLQEQRVSGFIDGAEATYPVFNLFNNAKLQRVAEDGVTPLGFFQWRKNVTTKLEVVQDTDSDWWTAPGKFLRLTVSWHTPDDSKYGSLWAEGQATVVSNSPNFIQTTRGFEYRVVKDDGIQYFNIGWESGRRALDLSKTSWTKATPLTYQRQQAGAICSYKVPESAEPGEFVVELRNIFVNLGTAKQWTLGISDLTALPIVE